MIIFGIQVLYFKIGNTYPFLFPLIKEKKKRGGEKGVYDEHDVKQVSFYVFALLCFFCECQSLLGY